MRRGRSRRPSPPALFPSRGNLFGSLDSSQSDHHNITSSNIKRGSNNISMGPSEYDDVPPESATTQHLKLPQFSNSEITLGRVVGQGGFSVVSEVISMDLQDVYDTDAETASTRMELAAAVNRRRGNSSSTSTSALPVVLKTLRTDLPEEEYAKGIADLAIEAEFLSVLQHPHIIAMRGMAQSDPHQPRFFVLLDRLSMTLDRRFNFWRKVVGDNAGYWIPCCNSYCCANAVALHTCWKERLMSARDIAAAVEYLHSRQIIYRDLKPDNLGFDAAGALRLFDFGLAKKLDQNVDKTSDGNAYLLTGNTGSLRYMAPEVAQDLPYNLTVDAYSFGILFWQMCSLTTPYAGYSQKVHAERVVIKGQRPKPDKSWPATWIQWMEQCWHRLPSQRPTFTAILAMLQDQVDLLAQDEDLVVPSRVWEIRAKKRRKRVKPANHEEMDVDTRLVHANRNGQAGGLQPGSDLV